jgi:hypothetical protein
MHLLLDRQIHPTTGPHFLHAPLINLIASASVRETCKKHDKDIETMFSILTDSVKLSHSQMASLALSMRVTLDARTPPINILELIMAIPTECMHTPDLRSKWFSDWIYMGIPITMPLEMIIKSEDPSQWADSIVEFEQLFLLEMGTRLDIRFVKEFMASTTREGKTIFQLLALIEPRKVTADRLQVWKILAEYYSRTDEASLSKVHAALKETQEPHKDVLLTKDQEDEVVQEFKTQFANIEPHLRTPSTPPAYDEAVQAFLDKYYSAPPDAVPIDPVKTMETDAKKLAELAETLMTHYNKAIELDKEQETHKEL